MNYSIPLNGQGQRIQLKTERIPLSQLNTATATPEPNPDFNQQFQSECIEGSAIAPCLYQATIEIHSDTEQAPGGEPLYPIHEALNWKLIRFGHQARPNLQAAFLLNEDQTPWQLKLDNPLAEKNGKTRKYETPKGARSTPFLPPIPPELRAKISQRHNIDIPTQGSFWEWLTLHPELPIIITEGGKKALSLLSQGYITIALYGVNGGYRTKDLLGNPIPPELIPELKPYLNSRDIYLAFDADIKPTASVRVNQAIARFGTLIEQTDCKVRVTTWKSVQGKGVDDLIVQSGIAAWEEAYTNALPLADWKIVSHLENQLTYSPTIQLNSPDLSQDQTIPQLPHGLIAIVSPKGTGKTKFIGAHLETDRAIGLTHRICLGRNLCQRWGLDYRGDLDKVNGDFITHSAYTLRIGLCVDSLLAIDPNKFADCDLIIDEVVQVLRHLLTSTTCRKDGKLPALLARLHDLIRNARRVIIADADLNNATIDYLKALREDNHCFLIENTWQTQGYNVRYIQAPNASPITGELLQDLQAGLNLFIATDSLKGSKELAKHCENLGITPLVINSQTSGGEIERDFINNPNTNAQNYQVVISSPSMATGVSIESIHFDRVYGLYYGASSTDAELAQSLDRVRDPIDRVVWCARMGRGFSKISRSTNPLQLKSDLKEQTDLNTLLLRSQLREDLSYELNQYDWQSDPHLNLWSRIEADRNWSMIHLRDALRLRLQQEGKQIHIVDLETDMNTAKLGKEIREQIKQTEAQTIVNARILHPNEAQNLEQLETIKPEDQLALKRFLICEFYRITPEDLTTDDVLADNNGRLRSELLNLESQLNPQLALERDLKTLEQQQRWHHGFAPWAFTNLESRRKIRQWLGLEDFIDPEKEWTADDLDEIAQKARSHTIEIKQILNFTITEKVSDVQIVHQLLRRIGIKINFRWSSSHPGHLGDKIRIYSLNSEHWQYLQTILERRQQWRNQQQNNGSPNPDSFKDQEGDLPQQAGLDTTSTKAAPPLSENRPEAPPKDQKTQLDIFSIPIKHNSLAS